MRLKLSEFKLIVLLVLVTSVSSTTSIAQSVHNVRAQQSGTSIQISYDLIAEQPAYISLLHSIDGGYRWIKIDSGLSGNVGFDQTTGKKNIIWNVLQTYEEFDKSDVKFKIEIVKTKARPLWAFYNGHVIGLRNKQHKSAFEMHMRDLPYPFGRYELQEVRSDNSMLLRISDYHCTTGPYNAAYSFLLPGLGSLKVKQARRGWTHMLIAAMTASVGFFAYNQYSKEYQSYIYAITESETRSAYKRATIYSRAAICSFGLTFGIGIYDAYGAFKKGKENKKLSNLNKSIYDQGGKVLYQAPLSAK